MLCSMRIILIFFLNISVCHNLKSQNLDSVISKLFFNANLNGEGSGVKNYFDTLKKLTASYDPPMVRFNLEPDSSIITPSYKFKKYDLLKFKFESGLLSMGAINITSGLLILNLTIVMSFTSKEKQLIAYNSLKQYLMTYPFKKFKTKIGNNFLEEIKFKNIGKSGSLSISKGKFDDKFYIYLNNSHMNL